MAGSVCLVIVGARATTGATTRIDITEVFGIGHNALRIDSLAGLFLTLLFAIAVCVSACFVSWVGPADRDHRRGTASGYVLLLGSVAVIICAADAFTFLFAWEMLTVSFYMLTSVTRAEARQAGAAWSTVSIGKVSGAALLFAFLLMAGRTHSLSIASWHAIGPGAVHDVAWALVVVGFGAKVGLVPLQVWIPVGYPAAPGPARAAMAGIAANVGVYGLWRFLGVLGRPPVWLVIAVLLVGGVTALLGITFAGVQGRLGRVIAYSSVENAGLIVTAYGVALTGSVVGSQALVAMGLLAATLQTVAHAIAKSALFTSLANVEAVTGTDELDALRGIGRRLRWSGAAFGAGAVTLAGLPPTIGFVSEWFILEALMQQFRVPGLAIRLGLAAAGALVALTTGLAALAFLRVIGLTFLGRPSNPSVEVATEPGPLGKAGVVALGFSCLGLAAVSPWEIRYISRGLAPIVPRHATHRGAEVPVGAPAHLSRVLDSLPVVAVGSHADRVCHGLPRRDRAVGWSLPARAPGAGLALGDVGRRWPLVVHRVRVRQPAPPRAGQRLGDESLDHPGGDRVRRPGSTPRCPRRDTDPRGRTRRDLSLPPDPAGHLGRGAGGQEAPVRPAQCLRGLHALRALGRPRPHSSTAMKEVLDDP